MKLENPRPTDKFNPLEDFSKEAIDMARLGKRALPLLPLSQEMNSRKAKSAVRSHQRMSMRLGDKRVKETTLEEALIAYQEKLRVVKNQDTAV